MAAIKKVLDDTIGDEPEARTRFFSWMRRELASKAVERMVFSAQTGVAPEGTWDQYKKMTQRAQIEFLALPTASYVDKVPDNPSEPELKKLYGDLKSKYRLVEHPDNGVRHAEELAIGWVKADFETFVKEEVKNVTDEQVEKYYEKNKINYKKPTKPPAKPPVTDDAKKPEDKDGEKGEGKTVEPKSEGDKPVTPEKGEAAPAKEEPAKEEPGKDTPPKDEPAKTDPAKPESPAKEEPKENAAAPKAEEPVKPGADPKESDEELSLVSLTSEQEPEKKPEQEPNEAAKPKETAPAQEKPTEEKPAESPKGDKPATEAAKPTETQEKPADPNAPATEGAPAAAQDEEFTPLSEVAEAIRTTLASPGADKRYNEAIQNAETELRALWKKVNLGEGKVDQSALKKFDFEAFAKKHGFTYGTIPLSPPDVVQKLEGLGSFPGFLEQAFFSDKPLLYEPRTIRNQFAISGETYIYWRTEQKDEFEPKFEDCIEDLKKAYRYKKAKELVKADAKAKAAEVKVGKTLKETFPKEKVDLSAEFSYTTPFSRGRVGQIKEIPGAGENFMKEVFKLQPLHATSIGLADESQYYVVYLSKYGYTEPELREQFSNFPILGELASAADQQENATRMATYNEFLDSLDRKFPNQTSETEE
jgi:hypothetical protein